MLVLVSPSRAFYAGLILLLPIALLLPKSKIPRAIWLVAAYLLVTLSLPSAWAPYFPTVWILFAVYIALGIPYWRNLRPSIAAVATAAIIGASAISAYRRMASYHREPPQKFERVAFEEGAIYSATPAVSDERGGLRIHRPQPLPVETLESGRPRNATVSTDTRSIHPWHWPEAQIYFELVSGGHSRIMTYDPRTKALQQLVSSNFEPVHPSISPDGTRLAFISHDRILVSSSGGVPDTIGTPAPVHDVAWFPSSQRLVYSAGLRQRSNLRISFRTTHP